MTKLKTRIVLILQKEKRKIDHSAYRDATEAIITEFEKTINKVEKDYWKSLNPYLKGLPIRENFPKQMEALDKVRKELKKR